MGRKSPQIFFILLPVVEKMTKTALKGEAEGQVGKPCDQPANRNIDIFRADISQNQIPVPRKVRMINEGPGLGESFHSFMTSRIWSQLVRVPDPVSCQKHAALSKA